MGGDRLVCYAIIGDEGLALTVELAGDIVVAEMMKDMDAAIARAQELRDSVTTTWAGFRDG